MIASPPSSHWRKWWKRIASYIAIWRGVRTMCGIAGFVSFNGSVDRGVLTAMTRSLERRGPDGFGIWADEGQGVGLGHQRLAILDLSAFANQPMHSHCGRYAMVYNGEIYNHRDIRRRLQAEASDLGSAEPRHRDPVGRHRRLGDRETLATLNGMFAIAVWDRKLRRFSGPGPCREKPLCLPGWRPPLSSDRR